MMTMLMGRLRDQLAEENGEDGQPVFDEDRCAVRFRSTMFSRHD
jgi:hypothetical protein